MRYLILIILMLLTGSLSEAQLRPLTNYFTISQLNQEGPKFGTYNVKGFVTGIYECPDCPEGHFCKPCVQDHVIISEVRSLLSKSELTDQEMILFSDDLSDLVVGKKYDFVIQVLDVKTTNQILNNIKLIYFQRIK